MKCCSHSFKWNLLLLIVSVLLKGNFDFFLLLIHLNSMRIFFSSDKSKVPSRLYDIRNLFEFDTLFISYRKYLLKLLLSTERKGTVLNENLLHLNTLNSSELSSKMIINIMFVINGRDITRKKSLSDTFLSQMTNRVLMARIASSFLIFVFILLIVQHHLIHLTYSIDHIPAHQ